MLGFCLKYCTHFNGALALEIFTEVYGKSIALLKSQSLETSWKPVEDSLKITLKPHGPDVTGSGGTQVVRDKLAELARGKGVDGAAKADAIVAASKPDTPGFQERAALLKTMQHFYLVEKKGNQSIWVMDPPKHYTSWVYDQFAGKSATSIRSELLQDEEVFGACLRQTFSDALQLARKWSADVEIKLALADADTLGFVRRWFNLDDDDESAVRASAATLLSGFKKITNACNGTKVIFSDLPPYRADLNADGTVAAIAQGEAMPVIYLFSEFIKMARPNSMGVLSKLWLCALTIIHELTHKLLNTEDHLYDFDGLKVKASFPAKMALSNADSWAHFAADVVGSLPLAARATALR